MKILNYEDIKDLEAKNLKILLYAEPLVGKTTFAATFPKPLVLSTDGNIKGLHNINKEIKVLKIEDFQPRVTSTGVEIQQSGWELFKDVVSNIDSIDAETIVVDLVRDIFEFMRADVLKRNGITHESEEKRMGKIWNLLDSEFLPVLRKLMNCDKNVVLIAHTKEKDSGIAPKLIDSLTQKIISYSDMAAIIRMVQVPGQDQPTRVLSAKAAPGRLAGNRINITSDIENPTYDKLITELTKGE